MEISEEIVLYGHDILATSTYAQLKHFIQHKNSTTYAHCLLVAMCSLAIADTLHLTVDRKALVRGALLHDYYLYDWHIERNHFHGFTHPACACRNAQAHFGLSEIESDIVRKHMFPLTIIPPKYRESWIVSLADKIVAIREMVSSRACQIQLAIQHY